MSGPLSTREKTLSILVGTVAFLLVTFFVTDYFLKSKARLTADLVAKARQVKAMQMRSADKAVWEQRAAWLAEKQPKTGDEKRAGVQLQEQIKELAKKNSVLLENPIIPEPASKPYYTAIGYNIQTKSTWKELIAFLGELQTPEQFIAFDFVKLTIDAADPTKMHGEFKIARWYAPK